jgi:broad specificity phosphatase PhoE
MRGILLVRHGNTTFDDKVDALLDPPIDEEGMERITRTVKFMHEEDFGIKRVISSPLQRTLRLALKIADNNLRVTTNNAALPWNLGDLMGKLTKVVQPKIDYLENYPDIKAPHGESYRTFYNRWSEFLRRLMTYFEVHPDESLVVVTHSRNIDAIESIVGDAPVGDVTPISPEASVTLLAKNGVSWTYSQIWNGK